MDRLRTAAAVAPSYGVDGGSDETQGLSRLAAATLQAKAVAKAKQQGTPVLAPAADDCSLGLQGQPAAETLGPMTKNEKCVMLSSSLFRCLRCQESVGQRRGVRLSGSLGAEERWRMFELLWKR